MDLVASQVSCSGRRDFGDLQNQEDTDGNMQITIEDSGPKGELRSTKTQANYTMLTPLKKVLSLGTAASNGYNRFDVRGTYMLSNLLQELSCQGAWTGANYLG